MRRPPLRSALALGAATLLTVVGCSSDIAGQGSPASPGASVSSSSASSTTSSTSSESSASSTESSAEATTTSTDTTAPTTAPSSAPSSTAASTSAGEEPTDFPTDFPSFGQELPAGWPAEIQMPPGATIFSSTTNAGEMVVTFQVSGTGADIVAFFDGELVAAGFTQTEKTEFGGVFTATYDKAGSNVVVTVLEYEGDAIGTVTVTVS